MFKLGGVIFEYCEPPNDPITFELPKSTTSPVELPPAVPLSPANDSVPPPEVQPPPGLLVE